MRKSIKAAKATASNVAAVSNVPAVIEPVITTIVPSTALVVSGPVIDNATGETVAPATVEAKPDPRVARAERIAADRASVHALYSAFEANRLSVPVKPLSAFKLATSTCHPVARNPSQRQAAAIAVALAASGVKLAGGASAARVFEIDGKPCAIENGVLRDAISSGLITISGATPEAERLTVAPKAAATISGLLGPTLLKAAHLI